MTLENEPIFNETKTKLNLKLDEDTKNRLNPDLMNSPLTASDP